MLLGCHVWFAKHFLASSTWDVRTEPRTSHCHASLFAGLKYKSNYVLVQRMLRNFGRMRLNCAMLSHPPPFGVSAPPPHPFFGGCASEPRFHHVNTTISHQTSAFFANVCLGVPKSTFVVENKIKVFNSHATKSFVHTGMYLLAPKPGV